MDLTEEKDRHKVEIEVIIEYERVKSRETEGVLEVFRSELKELRMDLTE